MKLRKIMIIAALVLFSTVMANNVKGAEYEASDIARVYIICDTGIDNLTKNSYQSADVEVVNADGTVDTSDSKAQVKLRGNSTSKAAKKPIKLKFSSKISFLGMDKGKKWNVLANAFDKSLIRNALCLNLADNIGLNYISQSRFVDLYYNGKYYGNYLVTEPVETGSTRVDIDESGSDFMIELERERVESDVTYINTKKGLRFAINAPEVPTETQYTYIEKYIANVETALASNKMSEISKYIDVDSFVNYYIVSEIFKAVDFNYSSTRFYVKNNKMYAGPVWDVDLSSGNASKLFYSGYYKYGESYKGLYCTEMKWYSYLIKNDQFVKKVKDRMNSVINIVENMYKTNRLGTNQIDLMMSSYLNSFERNYSSDVNGAGWSLTYRYSICDNRLGLEYDSHPATYKENVEMLRAWLNNRVNYLKSEWESIENNKVEELYAEKQSSTSVYLSWTNTGDADGNQIWIKSAGRKKYKLVKTIKDGYKQECIIKNLKPGIKYSFKVRSYIKDGDSKYYSEYISVNQTIKLKSPKCKVKKVKKGVRITWNKINGVDGYIIYKKNKQIKKIKGSKNNKFLYKKGDKKSQYKVKAYVIDNKRTVLSK